MNNHNLSVAESIIRSSGLVIKNSPSVEHPIPVVLSYRNNPDGSLCWLWPQGSKEAIFSRFRNHHSFSTRFSAVASKLLCPIGLGFLIAHGRMIVYADLPTATYITKSWGN